MVYATPSAVKSWPMGRDGWHCSDPMGFEQCLGVGDKAEQRGRGSCVGFASGMEGRKEKKAARGGICMIRLG